MTANDKSMASAAGIAVGEKMIKAPACIPCGEQMRDLIFAQKQKSELQLQTVLNQINQDLFDFVRKLGEAFPTAN